MVLDLHPKQRDVFQSEATEILFGGAAGPGKSYLLRAVACAWAAMIPGLQIYLFRRVYPELVQNHLMGAGNFLQLLEEWIRLGFVRYVAGPPPTFHFWNGSKILLRHCQHQGDLGQYQGAEIHVLLIDELTLWPEAMYRFLRSRVRLGGLKVPEEYSHLFPRVVAGSNPGGIGHTWVKMTFVDQGPWTVVQQPEEEGGLRRQFIPALLQDNPTLASDKGYPGRLAGLGNPALVKAMLLGLWDIVAGGMLDDVFDPAIHVVEPFAIPKTWPVRRAFDWGSSKPFSVGWWAQSDGCTVKVEGNDRVFPKGTRFRIAEWYGWNGKPNQGLRMTASEIARGILEREKALGIPVRPGPADPSIYAVENGRSIAQDMELVGVRFEPAENRPGSRINGWQQLRKVLKASMASPMEEPGLFVWSTCPQWRRTVPVLPRDTTKADDVDTDAEDHTGDETRYEVMTPARTARTVRTTGV